MLNLQKTYYKIILGCSVVCLLATFLVYFSFYKGIPTPHSRSSLLIPLSALVRNNNYIKIMLNFAWSLLMAFLTLVIIQVTQIL